MLRALQEDEIHILAASLSFTTIISLVPLLAVSLSVFHAFGGFEQIFRQIEPFLLRNIVEGSGASEVSKALQASITRIHSGALGLTGLLGLLLVSTKLFHDMDSAIQRIWRVKKKRSVMKRLVVYWLIMFLGPVALAVTLGVLGSKDIGLLQLLPRHFLAFSMELLAFILIYKIVPATQVRWTYAISGAIFATFGIWVAQEIYGEITHKILKYNTIYGSLAAIPIFFIWIEVLWLICLAGVSLTATFQHQAEEQITSVQ